MPRDAWNESYWKKMDRETERKIRTTCPRCGSSQTFYNKQYRNWRCARCEHIFFVKGIDGTADNTPWWKRIFRFRRD